MQQDKAKKYMILPGERLILEYLKGNTNWGDYMALKKEELKNQLYKGSYNVITDIRDVHVEFTLEMQKEVKKYVEYLSVQNIRLEHKTSVVTDTPKQLLHAEFFKMSGKNLPIQMKTFSTYKSALEYVEVSYKNHEKIMNHFEELKNG